MEQQLIITILWFLAGGWLVYQLVQIARSMIQRHTGQRSKTGIILVQNQEQVIEGVGRHLLGLYQAYPSLNLRLIFLDLDSCDQTKTILWRLGFECHSCCHTIDQLEQQLPGEEITVCQVLQTQDGRQICAKLVEELI